MNGSDHAERAEADLSARGVRAGDTFTVRVTNSMPTGNPICTMIYGVYELNIDLGRDFRPGATYTLAVNDKTTTFKT